MTTVERLYEEVMALPAAEREQLRVRMELAELGLSEEILQQWDKEDDERETAIKAGEPTVPWDEVRARMHERIRGAKH